MAIEQNRQPFTNVMALKVVHPAKEVGEALDLTTNSGSALCLIRVRGLDNRIVMSEEIYLKKSRYPNLETKDLSQSITSLLQEEYSVNVVKEHTNIQIVAVDRVVASYLEINEGESCFKIVRKRYDEANKIVDYNIEYWLHGAIEMESWADWKHKSNATNTNTPPLIAPTKSEVTAYCLKTKPRCVITVALLGSTQFHLTEPVY